MVETAPPCDDYNLPRLFDGDGYTDILFLGPGTNLDVIWYGSSTGAFTQENLSVSVFDSCIDEDRESGQQHDRTRE